MNKLKTASDPSGETEPSSVKRPLLLLGLSLLIWFPLITVIHAWIVTLFWDWFVVPQFHVAPLPLAIAAGLDILFGFLAYKYNPLPAHSEAAKEKNRELTWSERLSRAFVPSFGLALTRCGMILVFGFVAHLFVRV
ncbi:MAG: hypothetical protein ACRYFS_12185 [Janthinobacterium lividum]